MPNYLEPSDLAGRDFKAEPVGATLTYVTDSHGYVVVAASPTGKQVTLVPLASPDLSTGHKPAEYNGGYPVWSHTYTDEELAWMARPQFGSRTARWSEKKQGFYVHGARVRVGTARFYRNFSD